MLTGGSEAAITPHGPRRVRPHERPVDPQRRPGPRQPPLRPRPRRLRPGRRGRRPDPRGRASTPVPRRGSTPSLSATACRPTARTSPPPTTKDAARPRHEPPPCATRSSPRVDIDYINAHGTSTPLGDLAETIADEDGLRPACPASSQISSTKSQLGHLLGASGGVELIVSALAIEHQVCPAHHQPRPPRSDCDLDYIPNVARRWINRVTQNSFGFGGHNACLSWASRLKRCVEVRSRCRALSRDSQKPS